MAVSEHLKAKWCRGRQGRCRGAVSGVGAAAAGVERTDLKRARDYCYMSGKQQHWGSSLCSLIPKLILSARGCSVCL